MGTSLNKEQLRARHVRDYLAERAKRNPATTPARTCCKQHAARSIRFATHGQRPQRCGPALQLFQRRASGADSEGVMSNIKPGCLAILKTTARHPENRGALVECVRLYKQDETLPGHTGEFNKCYEPQWVIRGIGRKLLVDIDGWQELTVARQSILRPFGDQPGNESWITEARKKLPRTKDTPATINERGELQT